jgi:hypothetical protein
MAIGEGNVFESSYRHSGESDRSERAAAFYAVPIATKRKEERGKRKEERGKRKGKSLRDA